MSRREGKGGTHPPNLLQFGLLPKGGAPAPCGLVCFLLMAHKAHIFCRGCPEPLPVSRYVPGTLRNTSGVRILSSYISIFTSRPFSRLLVMSVISFGTPNNIRSPNHITHIIQNRHRTLSVRTIRVRELCRHDRETSLVNNQ